VLSPDTLLVELWLVLVVVWLAGAFTAKRVVRRQSLASRAVQLALVVGAYELLFDSRLAIGWLGWRFIKQQPGIVWAGVALTATGVATAVWARATLGGNWSATVTVKADHELVQRGPYRLVRHPIYSGFTLAAIGTALAIGQLRGVLAVALMLLGWRLKWPIEERFMIEQFGDRYVEYRKRVRAIIPGIW
jgi:protein-S-isoprenylcysteine O-methyltransferase Ste14